MTVYNTCILSPNSWAFKLEHFSTYSAATALTAYVADSHSGHVTAQSDIQVNQYPGRRDFKAIGSGGEDFKQTIVRAVEDVVGPVKEDRVVQRPSSQGKFISITLKDVKVQNPDQVCRQAASLQTTTSGVLSCTAALVKHFYTPDVYLQVLAVYEAMRRDKRLRYYL